MPRTRKWTRRKRQQARQKANAALRERRQLVAQTRDREDSQHAGLVPLVQYAEQQLRLRARLTPRLDMRKGQTAEFSPLDEALAYLGSQMLGIVRLNHLDRLLPEGALAQVLGLKRWPSENTLQRFLKRATEATLTGLDQLQGHLVAEVDGATFSLQPIEVDGDVTGIPQRARKREGVQSGYCLGRARPCYQQPRVTVNGLPEWTELRPGNDGCTDVFDRALTTAERLARQHPGREVWLRLDGYYASKEHLRLAQAAYRRQRNLWFFLAVPSCDLAAGRWEELTRAGEGRWQRVSSTTAIRELGAVRLWDGQAEAVRAVAVRRQPAGAAPGDSSARSARYHKCYLILTAVPHALLGTPQVFRAYQQRQREEFSFKDGKQSLALLQMPTQELRANRLHVRLVALAQLLMQGFARACLPHPGPYGPTCKTVREKVVSVGGEKSGGRGRPGRGRAGVPRAGGGSRWRCRYCRCTTAIAGCGTYAGWSVST